MTNLLKIARIRALNDEFRADTSHYQFSAWLSLWPLGDQCRIKQFVKEYDDFLDRNRPHSECNFGSFEYAEQRMYWRIHYYANDRIAPSPDPSDHALTVRVLMVMLASEDVPHPPCFNERNPKRHVFAALLRKITVRS